MRQTYRVTIEGRIFEGRNPRVLLRKAVQAKRRLDTHRRCNRCKKVIQLPSLVRYRLCFECVDQAVTMYTEALVERTAQRVKSTARCVS